MSRLIVFLGGLIGFATNMFFRLQPNQMTLINIQLVLFIFTYDFRQILVLYLLILILVCDKQKLNNYWIFSSRPILDQSRVGLISLRSNVTVSVWECMSILLIVLYYSVSEDLRKRISL
uniref:7TM_GPCR_Srx domain-containing protein n=1 Tax=Heterorhabditis bacteriophora TaxID=37862 RepID=A0A1I7WEB1_HETBA